MLVQMSLVFLPIAHFCVTPCCMAACEPAMQRQRFNAEREKERWQQQTTTGTNFAVLQNTPANHQKGVNRTMVQLNCQQWTVFKAMHVILETRYHWEMVAASTAAAAAAAAATSTHGTVDKTVATQLRSSSNWLSTMLLRREQKNKEEQKTNQPTW